MIDIDDDTDDEHLPVQMFDGLGKMKINHSAKGLLQDNQTHYTTMDNKTIDEKDCRTNYNPLNTTRPNSSQNMFI